MRMRSMMLLVALLLVAGSVSVAQGCVGKSLLIGVATAPEEQLLAEMIAQLVTERTGTTVKIQIYPDSRRIYEAVRKGDVGLIIETPDAAMTLLGRSKVANRRNELDMVRKEYRKTYNLVWLDSVPNGAFFTPVLAADTLNHLPALPKLINKLPSVLTDETLQKLAKTMRGDEKARKIARDFLKAKKLI